MQAQYLVDGADVVCELLDPTARRCAIFESITDSIVVCDMDGNIKQVNDVASYHLGSCTREELIGQSILRFIASEDHTKVLTRMRRLIQNKALQRIECKGLRGRGIEFDCELGMSLVTSESGKNLALTMVLRDITESKKAEEALRASENKFRVLFNNMTEAFGFGAVIIDSNTNIPYDLLFLDVNKAWEEMTGYSRNKIIGRTYRDAVPDFEAEQKTNNWVEICGRVAFTGEPVSMECTTNANKWLNVYLYSPVKGRWASITTDITERKQHDEARQFYINQITVAQEEERKRIARELHDETIQSLLCLLQDVEAITSGKDRLPGNVVIELEKLRSRINSIATEVRNFTHELRPDILDQMGLGAALQLLVDETKKDSEMATRFIITGTERRIAPEVELVLFRIAQEALRNIMKHACATEAIVNVNYGLEKVKLIITDNGKGFKKPRVTGQFIRQGKLGLAGMYERAKIIGGALSLKSQPGNGTRIFIEVQA